MRETVRTRLLAEHVFDEVSDDALVCKDDLAHCRERLFAERQQQVASICLEKDVGKSAQFNARAQITRMREHEVVQLNAQAHFIRRATTIVRLVILHVHALNKTLLRAANRCLLRHYRDEVLPL